jgi:hypothetical protein
MTHCPLLIWSVSDIAPRQGSGSVGAYLFKVLPESALEHPPKGAAGSEVNIKKNVRGCCWK